MVSDEVYALVRRVQARAHGAPLLVDTLLALVLFGASLLPLLGVGEGCGCDEVPWWSYLAVAGQTLQLAARRRWPFWVALSIAPFSILYGLAQVPESPVPFGPLVAVYTVSAYASRRRSYLTAALAALMIAVVPGLDSAEVDVLDYTNNALVFGGAWLLGDSARNRRAYLRATEERATRAETEQQLRAERAAAEERTHIAREMHDVLAHSMSLIVIQAEAGPVAMQTDPERASRLFDQISQTGRHALLDLRRLLGLLREESHHADRAPQPGVESIADLVQAAERTGMDVRYRVEGAPFEVSAGTGLTAYRVVQEGLTNAARHAASARVRVLLAYDADALRVEVIDDLPQPSADAAASELPGAGVGLAGLRERVEAAEGQFSVGPAGSGWALAARLPLPATLRAGPA